MAGEFLMEEMTFYKIIIAAVCILIMAVWLDVKGRDGDE